MRHRTTSEGTDSVGLQLLVSLNGHGTKYVCKNFEKWNLLALVILIMISSLHRTNQTLFSEDVFGVGKGNTKEVESEAMQAILTLQPGFNFTNLRTFSRVTINGEMFHSRRFVIQYVVLTPI